MSLEDLTPQQRAHLSLGELLMQDPDASREARRLAKKLNPKLQFADIDLEDRLAAQQKANDERWEKEQERQRKEKFDRERALAHDKCRAHNLDPAAVEDVMTKMSIASYDAAIELLESRAALAAPTPESVTPMTLPDNKALWKDPVKWARETAHQAINELKRVRIA